MAQSVQQRNVEVLGSTIWKGRVIARMTVAKLSMHLGRKYVY